MLCQDCDGKFHKMGIREDPLLRAETQKKMAPRIHFESA